MRFYKRASDGTWHVDFWHNGRRVRTSTGTADRQSAREWAERYKAQLWRAERLGERPAVTWDAAVLEWLVS